MAYKFYDMSKKQEYSIDLPNCKISGNTTSYEVKNGKIFKYSIMNGVIDKSTSKEVEKIELTNYQMVFINLLKGKDGNSSRLDSNDLKGLNPFELEFEVDDIYAKNNIYQTGGLELSENSASLKVYAKNNMDAKNISIELEKEEAKEEDGFFTKMCNRIYNYFFEDETSTKEQPKAEAAKAVQQSANKPVTKPVVKQAKSNIVKKPKVTAPLENTLKNVKIAATPNTSVIPEKTYVVKAGDNSSKIAEAHNIPVYMLKKANPSIKNLDQLNVGQKITIPKHPILKLKTINNMNDVVTATGVSKNYIKDILMGIEGRKSEPDLKAYYDGVKDAKHPKGYLTIGFGHTGKVRNTAITEKTKITRKEAFQLLAQDILNAKMVAISYFGENFNKAPQSIQNAIIDIIFNKGIEGLEKEGSLTTHLKNDLAKRDYASAASHVIYKTEVKGLKKRNAYRFIIALKDLSPQDRIKAINLSQSYYNKVVEDYKDSLDAKPLQQAMVNAKRGKFENFFGA